MASEKAWLAFLRGRFDGAILPSLVLGDGVPRLNVPDLATIKDRLRADLVADWGEVEPTAEAALASYVPSWTHLGNEEEVYTHTWRDGVFVTIPPEEPTP